MILGAIFDEDFLPCSEGYRPKRRAKEAGRDRRDAWPCGRYGSGVEAAMQGCFDTIDHQWMLRMLEQRIDDKPCLRLIPKWLKAGMLEEDGKGRHPATGTPQGGWSRRSWRTCPCIMPSIGGGKESGRRTGRGQSPSVAMQTTSSGCCSTRKTPNACTTYCRNDWASAICTGQRQRRGLYDSVASRQEPALTFAVVHVAGKGVARESRW